MQQYVLQFYEFTWYNVVGGYSLVKVLYIVN